MKTILILTAIAISLCSCQEKSADSEATSAAVTQAYPLDVCIVSGEPLGSMGDPVVLVHEGQEIKFCCDSCQPKFEANPEKYLSKLEE